MNIAQKIKKLRLDNGFTQQDMSVHLGICDTTYRKLEKGSISPNMEIIEKLSKFYKVSSQEFISKDEHNEGNDSGTNLVKKLLLKVEENEVKNNLIFEQLLEIQKQNAKIISSFIKPTNHSETDI